MERAPLRPVPRRPDGPVDPSEATAHVAAALPAADETAGAVLALVDIAGRSRAEAAAERGLAADEVGDALARGRKQLRRSLYPLPGSGWCERAERMISDRLDGELEPPGPARLNAHLHNCPRCVEHDLRLAQAIDTLVAGFIEAHPGSTPAAEPVRIRPTVIRAARPQLHALPFGQPIALAPARPPVEDRVAQAPPVEAPPVELPVETPPGAPVPVEPAAAALPLAWRAMYALAVLFAVLTVVLTALGVAGVDPF